MDKPCRKDKKINNQSIKKKFKVSKPPLNIEISHKWTVTVVVLAFVLSVAFSSVTSEIMSDLNVWWAFFVLILIIIVNILFDMVGTAVATAEEKPFHSLASRKVMGAEHTVKILRKAPQTANLCNDVIGDIAGIISGASVAIAVNELAVILGTDSGGVNLVLTGLVAALTIGGKAFFKGVAMQNCNKIVFFIGKLLYMFSMLTVPFKRKKKGSRKK